MTPYQFFLLGVLVIWPFAILGLLFLMSRLERYVQRNEASTPQQAGLEPVAGASADPEVKIVFGDQVIGEPGSPAPVPSDPAPEGGGIQ